VKNRRRSYAGARLFLVALLATLLTNAPPWAPAAAQLKRVLVPAPPPLPAIPGAREKASRELVETARDPRRGNARVRVIVQLSGAPGPLLGALLGRADVRERARFGRLGSRVVELPLHVAEKISRHREVKFVSPDRETFSFGHVTRTTGADDVRGALGLNLPGLDGSGVGIAVLDSGVDTDHVAFRDANNRLRVRLSRDFTGEGRTDDPHGHGTHVASIAAGNGRVARGEYTGVAPNAHLVNLRVLDSRGTGRVSNILAALDWVLANRTLHNIRVVNLSLGTAAVESYKDDPVCQAVRRLVDAGLVVVAAAGNNGKDASGEKLYGYIHAPGNEPSAITVGASNTFGTDFRSDDGVATYSSRGPTRSGETGLLGVRRHDNLVKPDLVAPGNKIIDAAAEDNFLLRTNPSLDAGVSEADSRRMMFLNGTSMATPMVAGAAALMLQANPTLTPNLVKAILMYTAQPLAGFNMLEQGAGQLNVEGAVRLARLVRKDLSALTPLGAPLLSALAPPAPRTTIAGQSFAWAQGIIVRHGYASGAELVTRYQKIYGQGVLVTDGVFVTDGVLVTDGKMLSAGVLVTDHVVTSGGGLLGTGTVFLGAGVLVTDHAFTHDGVLVTDGQVSADTAAQALSATLGGDPAGPTPVVEDCGGGLLCQ